MPARKPLIRRPAESAQDYGRTVWRRYREDGAPRRCKAGGQTAWKGAATRGENFPAASAH